jgi:hypothetical protein
MWMQLQVLQLNLSILGDPNLLLNRIDIYRVTLPISGLKEFTCQGWELDGYHYGHILEFDKLFDRYLDEASLKEVSNFGLNMDNMGLIGEDSIVYVSKLSIELLTGALHLLQEHL